MAGMGTRIRELREKAGLTRLQLAELLCTQPKTIEYWESGVHTPRLYLLSGLAKIFNTTTDYLLWGEQISVERIVKDKVIDKVIVAPRLDKTGYYIQFYFVDKSELRITDKILYKNFGNDNYKEIMV